MPRLGFADLQLMQSVIAGTLPQEQFYRLEPRRHRVCAAVAFMLLHWEDYLTPNLAINREGQYGNYLVSIIDREGEDSNVLVTTSHSLGLHSAESRGGRPAIILTPPITLNYPLEADRRRALQLLNSLRKESREVLLCLVYELRTRDML